MELPADDVDVADGVVDELALDDSDAIVDVSPSFIVVVVDVVDIGDDDDDDGVVVASNGVAAGVSQYNSATEDDFIVICRRCSSSRLSRNLRHMTSYLIEAFNK
jgi:hypothetical protein